jgi:hypothetical protein
MLEACGGNKTEAARRLRTSRQHLHRVLKQVQPSALSSECESVVVRNTTDDDSLGEALR